MKNISLLLLGCLFWGCQGGFVIEGTAPWAPGPVWLLAPKAVDQVDTLAQGQVQDGRFRLKGSVALPTYAWVQAQSSDLKIPVFLDNTPVQISVDPSLAAGFACVGGPLQEIYSQYLSLRRPFDRQRDSLMEESRAARRRDDYFWHLHIRALIEDLDSLYEQAENTFLQDQDNVVAAGILCHRLPELRSKKLLHAKLEYLGPQARLSGAGEVLAAYARLQADTRVGAVVPNFTLPTLQGDSLGHYAVQARVKIIDLWASWCNPCRAEHPHLKSLYARYRSLGLEIIGISLDNQREKWEQAVVHDQLPWLQLSDLQGWNSSAARLFGVRTIPYMLVLDARNRILAVNPGHDELEALLSGLLPLAQ